MDLVKELPDDVRWVLFVYATRVKGVSYRELGVSSAMGNMVKNRRRRVSDEVLNRVLEKLTAKDLLELLHSLRGGPSSSWLGRRPDAAEVRGSNPRGPTTKVVI